MEPRPLNPLTGFFVCRNVCPEGSSEAAREIEQDYIRYYNTARNGITKYGKLTRGLLIMNAFKRGNQ